MRLYKLLYFISPILSLILMLLPGSIIISTIDNSGEQLYSTYNYFSLEIIKSGNIFPILIVASIFLLILSLLLMLFIDGSYMRKISLSIATLPAIFSLLHLIIYFKEMSYLSYFVTLLIFLEAFLLLPFNKKSTSIE